MDGVWEGWEQLSLHLHEAIDLQSKAGTVVIASNIICRLSN